MSFVTYVVFSSHVKYNRGDIESFLTGDAATESAFYAHIASFSNN